MSKGDAEFSPRPNTRSSQSRIPPPWRFLSISLLNNKSTNKEKVSWLTGLLTGWGIKESWAKVIAGAVIGALVAAGILTQPGCAHSVDVSPNRTEVCKDGSCLVIEQGHISYSQAQPETDVPPVVQPLKK